MTSAENALVRPTISELVKRATGEFGESDYVVTLTERLTVAEAERRSALVARWLLHEGVGKGTRVGLFFPSGPEWAVWWLAVSRIGAVAVPLSTLLRPAEIARIVRLADVAVLVGPRTVLHIDVADRLEAAFADLTGPDGQEAGRLELTSAPYLRQVVLIASPDPDRPEAAATAGTAEAAAWPGWATRWEPAGAPMARGETLAAVEAEVSPADLAIMIHTSGSTADPKGVLHTHGTLVRQTSAWAGVIRGLTGVDHAPRVLCAMPFFWIGGILAVTGALHEPVTLLVQAKLDAGPALDLAERERANGVVGWPAFTQQLRLHPSFPDRDLRGAPMLRDGPVDLAMTGVPDGHPIHRSLTESAGSFAYTDTAIVDADGRPVPDGTIGELLIRGPGSMTGYNKRERSEVFDADGWYHTGDRVYRRGGDPRLFYVGRDSELIKVAGANVSPREVEAVIEEFPEVAHCLVTGVEHPTRGEEVAVVLVPAPAASTGTGTAVGTVDVEVLAARARGLLSSYKVPTRWIIATAADVPSLPSGKPDRRGLRARLERGGLG
ncbi:class I adenylate-forming enzyme family protein [Frankia sp. R82]|uniref:class I adenylate-forming enzyme family protein n=1 Tax=Frankia sp. R82 TaxID=2950553 RepID=UPI0020440976|nr:class I adenylate-forming enzyme family protein [Frankia sp. R82]MCM3883888.1 acyl--CoA ligase [Frankia sp. R82]